MFLHLLIHHKYLFLFLGLFVSGESVFLIGIYFSLIGALDLGYVIALTFFSSLFAEVLWYWIGTKVTYERLKSLPYFRSRNHHIDRLEKFMTNHSLKALFYSKFAYGTRTIAQILCGTHKVDFKKYILVNILGTVAIIIALVSLSQFLDVSLSAFRHAAHRLELGFAILIILVIAVHLCIKKFFLDKMGK
jgi:membrane-associated protein